MQESTFTVRAPDGVDLFVYRWSGQGSPKGVLQIAHGGGEHALRYKRLAEALVDRGYPVYANDHRGHGQSVRTEDELGDFGQEGWEGLVADLGRVMDVARREQPNVPLILFGHSTGSFAVQDFLLDHSDRVDGAVLSGTAAMQPLVSGFDLDKPLDLTAINAPFEPARTPFDWLSRDEAEVDRYMADPLCGFNVGVAGVRGMAAAGARTADPARLARIRKDLPLYLMAGERDPVNGGLVLLNMLVEQYRAAGLTDVTVKTYPEARHEILNETNRDEVTANLIAWLDGVVSRSGKAVAS